MEERPLGGSGIEITRIILGCGNFGGDRLRAGVLRAGRVGGRRRSG